MGEPGVGTTHPQEGLGERKEWFCKGTGEGGGGGRVPTKAGNFKGEPFSFRVVSLRD
jgi:hypothetical protein